MGLLPLYGRPAASPPGMMSPQYLLLATYVKVESKTAGFAEPFGRSWPPCLEFCTAFWLTVILRYGLVVLWVRWQIVILPDAAPAGRALIAMQPARITATKPATSRRNGHRRAAPPVSRTSVLFVTGRGDALLAFTLLPFRTRRTGDPDHAPLLMATPYRQPAVPLESGG